MKKNYTTPMSHLAGTALLLLALLILPFGKLQAQDNPFGLQAVDVFRCGDGPVTLVATVSPTFPTENIRWYTEPFYGTPIESGPTLTIDMLERSTVFFIDYVHVNEVTGMEECGICDRIAVRATVFRGETDSDGNHIIESRIFYQRASFCNNVEEPQEVTHVGSLHGVYSAEHADGPGKTLNIDPHTGAVTPHGSDVGTYTVRYTPPDQDGCNEPDAITTLTIASSEDPPSISYPAAGYCSNHSGTVAVSLTGSDNGFYSASPAGLTIDASTGAVDPSESQGGDYTITYTVPGLGGCELQTATTQITIETALFAIISYDEPYCHDDDEKKTAVLVGSTGGIYNYSGPGTLSGFDTSDGSFTPGEATEAGLYTITYTLTAGGIYCSESVSGTSVLISPSPNSGISVDETEVFAGDPMPVVTFAGIDIMEGTTPFTFYYQDAAEFTIPLTGENGTATVTHDTELVGTFTYTLLRVSDANGCTTEFEPPKEIIITVKQKPELNFFYAEAPYCSNYIGDAIPTFFPGSVSGTFTAEPTGLSLTAETGVVDIGASEAGTYTVTNTLDGFSASTTLIITKLADASISYDDDPYCATGIATPTLVDAGGIFGGDALFVFDEGAAPGTVDLRTTGPGTFTVTYRFFALNGCPEVISETSITILPVVVFDGTSQQVLCSGEETEIVLAASLSGTPVSSTFTWTIGTVSGSITGQQASTGGPFNDGYIIAHTLTNSGTTDGFVEYIITPIVDDEQCTPVPETVLVRVKAVPRLTSAATIPDICGGELVEYTPASDYQQSDLTFNWTRQIVAGIAGGAGATGAGNISETLTSSNSEITQVTYDYVLVPEITLADPFRCDGTGSVTVNVKPGAPGEITGTTCIESGTTHTYTGPVGMDSYAWSIIEGDGLASFSGPTTAQSVSVAAGATAEGTFTLQLYAETTGCPGTYTLDVKVLHCGDVTFTYRGSTVSYGTIFKHCLCWMDRNLGASNVGSSNTDANGYGDLFQWGRGSDNHQDRGSSTVAGPVDTDTPGHDNFITIVSIPENPTGDWRSPQNNNLWQGVNSTNNPCPTGWRLPTEDELQTEIDSWSPEDATGAWDSALKWPLSGKRWYNSGNMHDEQVIGYVWSSSIDTPPLPGSKRMAVNAADVNIAGDWRAYGYSVRCVRE
jgi:hypothetical protein